MMRMLYTIFAAMFALSQVFRNTADIDGLEHLVREPWATAALNTFTFTSTRYVSAADGNCSYDGTAATFVSGTTGPWADLNCLAARQAIGGSAVAQIVYIRAG